MSHLDRQWDEAEKALALYVPPNVKADLVLLAEDLNQDLRVLFMDGDKVDFTLNTADVKDEVLFNAKMDQLVAENEKDWPDKKKRYWCEECEDGNYFYCSYATRATGVGANMTCPEYEHKKVETSYKKEHRQPLKPLTVQGCANDGAVTRQDPHKYKSKPIPIQPLTGAQSAPKTEVKTGFQMPKKSTTSIP